MANYIIIGGDNKEYGPVSEAEVRQWIAEGRLSAESRIKAESDAEFRALALFPEFAAALSTRQSSPPPTLGSLRNVGGEREAALQQVRGPAIALQVVSGINVVLSLWNIIRLVFLNPSKEMAEQFAKYPQLQDPAVQKWITMMYGPIGIGSNIFELAMTIVIFWGAFQMQKLQGYTFALVAAIMAMIPCVSACCLLGLPFGIWAVIVLNKPEVKSRFE